MVCLNLLIGSLLFHPSKTLEFKSSLDFKDVLEIIGDSRNLVSLKIPSTRGPNKSRLANTSQDNVSLAESKQLNFLSDFLTNQVKKIEDKESKAKSGVSQDVKASLKMSNYLIDKAQKEIKE